MAIFRHGKVLGSMGVALLALAAGAQAGRGDASVEMNSTVIRYSGSALHSEQGIEQLYARLNRAARAVCGSADARVLTQLADWRRCRDAALDDAVADVNNTRLSMLHSGAVNGRRLIAGAQQSAPGADSGS